MGRWNDPEREDNAEALRRRLAAARSGREAEGQAGWVLQVLLVIGLLGLGLLIFASV